MGWGEAPEERGREELRGGWGIRPQTCGQTGKSLGHVARTLGKVAPGRVSDLPGPASQRAGRALVMWLSGGHLPSLWGPGFHPQHRTYKTQAEDFAWRKCQEKPSLGLDGFGSNIDDDPGAIREP